MCVCFFFVEVRLCLEKKEILCFYARALCGDPVGCVGDVFTPGRVWVGEGMMAVPKMSVCVFFFSSACPCSL